MASLWDALKQYIEDASPGGALNPEVTPQGVLDAAAISTMPVPVLGDVLGAGADIYRMAKNPEERTLGNAGLAALGLIPFVPGITAWHGSPYKFGAFDPTKIGSGEGAQAYGYGHYVAESPGVAKSYRTAGGAKKGSTPDIYAADIVGMMGGEEKALKHLNDVLPPKGLETFSGESHQFISDVINAVQSGAYKKKLGSIYKIDLPDEHVAKMLNWDQELGKQTPEIMKLAKQHGLAMDDLGGDLVARMDAKTPAGAEAMRQAGVPGIKYFDAQSRGGKMADTQNFVVFPGNEGLIKMLEMNDKPMSFWGF